MSKWADAAAEYRDKHPDAVRREYCEHGLEFGMSALDGIAFAGGIAFCKCHKANYGYVDSGWSSFDGKHGGTTTDKHLCGPCGGKKRKYGDDLDGA